MAEHFGALAELRDAGLIRHLGVCNVRPHHLPQAQAVAPVVGVQNAYGLGFRPGHDQIPGTGDPDHLVANVAAGALRLTDGDLARLEAVHRRGE